MGDTVFIGSCGGTFYALEKASGLARWQYDIRQDGRQTSFHGDPLVDGSRILVATDHSCTNDGIGHVYAFSVKTGAIEWKLPSEVGLSTNIVRVGSSGWVGRIDGGWARFELATGRSQGSVALNKANIPCELPKWIVASGRQLFTVGRDNAVYSISQSGKIRWRHELPAPASTPPVIFGHDILVGSDDQRLYRLSGRKGVLSVYSELTGVPIGRPLVIGDTVYLFLSRADGSGAIAAVRAGKPLWIVPLSSKPSSEQPYVRNTTVLAGMCDGTLIAVHATDGEPAWTLSLDGCIRSIGGDGVALFVGAEQGTVYALEP
ncbi:MAG: PQQ-binding-like beta-propeller repeat protein [Acidobacteria bacterium]|nr:PQQ-binding-like beta-propeller repeat protein [Acidobacteriota bacterium]